MSNITQYNIYSYIQGINGFGLPFTNTTYSATLTANTPQSITVPGGAAAGAAGATYNKFIMIITPEVPNDTWVAVGATAAIPAGATFAVNASSLIAYEMGRYVRAGDVVSLLSVTGGGVGVQFYAVQE
ncbi:MAG: hypothetical protein ABIP54_02220 [Candidatus Andersenbacteria bacterium]